MRWAGQNGIFWRGFDSIAEALGKSVRQVKTDVAVLEAKGLIRHTSRRRNSNVYEFLWHALFEVRQTALQQSGFEVQDSHLEVQGDVVLEVQPTARESSPLESSVKADNKRISGHASQKSRSAASLRVLCSQDLESEPSKADVPSQASAGPGPLKGEGPADGWTSEELATVRSRIVQYWGREPEEGFEVSAMLRARGAGAAEVCDLFDRKFSNKNLRVGGRHAPRSQNWFPVGNRKRIHTWPLARAPQSSPQGSTTN